MSGLRERLAELADEFARDAANAQVGARNAGEADDGIALAVWESERLTYRDVERRVRALLAEDEPPATPDDVEATFVDVLAGVRCEARHDQIVGASCVNCQSWARTIGLPFWRPLLTLARREGADAALAPVEALLALYESWQGERDHPGSSSPRQRDQLRAALAQARDDAQDDAR